MRFMMVSYSWCFLELVNGGENEPKCAMIMIRQVNSVSQGVGLFAG